MKKFFIGLTFLTSMSVGAKTQTYAPVSEVMSKAEEIIKLQTHEFIQNHNLRSFHVNQEDAKILFDSGTLVEEDIRSIAGSSVSSGNVIAYGIAHFDISQVSSSIFCMKQISDREIIVSKVIEGYDADERHFEYVYDSVIEMSKNSSKITCGTIVQ